jgi:SAM-dependent methyltransferase
MLDLARQNAPSASFVLADARRFSFQPAFHAVLSSFNSLAHAATLDELTCILRNARSALKHNGAVLFDLSMEEAYTSKWRGSFGENHRDVAWTVRPSYDRIAHSAQNHVTVSRRNGGSWDRTEFVITQRCFSEYEIRNALTRADFTRIASSDAERDLGMINESGRRFFLCV